MLQVVDIHLSLNYFLRNDDDFLAADVVLQHIVVFEMEYFVQLCDNLLQSLMFAAVVLVLMIQHLNSTFISSNNII